MSKWPSEFSNHFELKKYFEIRLTIEIYDIVNSYIDYNKYVDVPDKYFGLHYGSLSVWFSKHSTKNPLGIVPGPETQIIDISKFE